MYGSVAAVGFVWLYFCLPETKGLSLEEIERLFRGSSNLRRGRRGGGNGAGAYDVISNDGYDDDDNNSIGGQEDVIQAENIATELS